LSSAPSARSDSCYETREIGEEAEPALTSAARISSER